MSRYVMINGISLGCLIFSREEVVFIESIPQQTFKSKEGIEK